MWDDGFEATLPVKFGVNNPNSVRNILVERTYNKAAALMRYLESIVGENSFRLTLRVRIFISINYAHKKEDIKII
jgi:aminopeptidase N